MKKYYWLEVSYPMKYFLNNEDFDSKILNHIGHHQGYDSGAGFGFRDMQIPFDSEDEANEALQKLKSFRISNEMEFEDIKFY